VVRGRGGGVGVGLAAAALLLPLLGAGACASPADGPLGEESEAAESDADPTSTEPAVPSTDGPATTVPPDAPRYAIGTCVDWDPATADDPARPGGFAVVECDQPHRGETVGPSPGLDTPGHLYPAPDALIGAATRSCVRQAEKYLGDALDDEGRFVLTAMPPSHELWESGYRTVECVLASRSEAPSQLLTGSARGAPQWWAFAAGDCLAFPPEAPEPLAVVACDQPHQAEIAGTVALEDQDYDPTSVEAIEACLDVAIAYLGHIPEPPWLAPMIGPEPEEWADGQHNAYCALIRFDDEEDDEPAVVSGPAP
jgi:Septum formation